MMELVDTGIILAFGGSLFAFIKIVYDIRVEQRRLQRALYGDPDDATRPGLLSRQAESYARISRQMEQMEEQMDNRFDELEGQIEIRDGETRIILSHIIDHMENPPDDLEIRDVYGLDDEFR